MSFQTKLEHWLKQARNMDELERAWREEEAAADIRNRARARGCGCGYVWFSYWHTVEEADRLVDEEDRVQGMERWRWLEQHEKECFRRSKAARPKCGARTRSGAPCKAPVARREDGRLARKCRRHGGLSTGPRTMEGLAAIARSNRKRAQDRAQAKAQSQADVQEVIASPSPSGTSADAA